MSRSIRRAVLAGAVTIAAPFIPIAAQSPFEGVITMRLTGSGPAAGTTQDAEYYASRSGKARVILNTPMGKASIIMAPADGKMYMLMDQMSQYIEADLANLTAPESTADAPRIIRTGKKETIAGWECEHVTVDQLDVCAAKGLGAYLNVGGNLMMRGGMQPWQSAVLKENIFPLKVTLPDGKVQMEVTKIEKKSVEPSMFQVPANYTKVTLPSRGG
jgi:hypothetical protein